MWAKNGQKLEKVIFCQISAFFDYWAKNLVEMTIFGFLLLLDNEAQSNSDILDQK